MSDFEVYRPDSKVEAPVKYDPVTGHAYRYEDDGTLTLLGPGEGEYFRAENDFNYGWLSQTPDMPYPVKTRTRKQVFADRASYSIMTFCALVLLPTAWLPLTFNSSTWIVGLVLLVGFGAFGFHIWREMHRTIFRYLWNGEIGAGRTKN